MDFQLLFSACDHLRIKSHTPGSLKLGVSPGILSVPGVADLKKPSDLPRGIRKVDLSVFTMTASIDYDPALIAPALVDELLSTPDPARGRAILEELDKALEMGLAAR
ncbi:hypothetical protein [Desulfocurvus sp. DL9XJH121]